MRNLAKRLAVLATAAALGIGGTAAWAAWTAHGSGAGRGRAGQSLQISTLGTTSHGTLLYPGGSGDLTVNVNNGNAFPIRVTTVVPTAPAVADPAHHAAGCSGSATGVTVDSFTTVTLPVPANAHQEFTLANVVHMSSGSDNACQGAVFTIPVVLVAASA